MSSKGSEFERSTCKQLSLWWTLGERDDVFWRSQGSGGRAHGRAKKGQTTEGQYGDIAATDPVGQALTARITFELKRGYKLASPYDALDSKTTATMMFTTFIKQAALAAAHAETPVWALITRRDRRDEILTVPFKLYGLIAVGCRRAGYDFHCLDDVQRGRLFPITTFCGKVEGMQSSISTVSCRLSDFLSNFTPEMVRTI